MPRVSGWLRLNELAVQLIRNAADCPRALAEPPGAPSDADENERPLFPRACCRHAQLLAATVADGTREARWAAACDDASRLYRMAGHMRQTTMKWNPLDEMIAHMGYQMLVILLERRVPGDIDALRRDLRDAWTMKTLSETEFRP